MQKDTVLSSMAKHYPKAEQRFIFIDIFGELFANILKETKRFLGDRLAKRITNEIERIHWDLQNLSVKTAYTDRLIATLGHMIRGHS